MKNLKYSANSTTLHNAIRRVSPHSIPGSIADKMNTIAINTGRFAEVWTDEYKEFYYKLKSCELNYFYIPKERAQLPYP